MNPATILWLIAGCLMLQPLSTDLYLASLPNLAEDFAVSPAAVQQTLSLFVIGFGLAQLISGPLSDRFGRRPVLLAGLSVYILSSVSCALVPSLDMLIAARFVQAIGCCTAAVVARTLIRDVYSPAEGASMMARASTLLALAPIFGPILGGYLQVWFGWRAGFIFHTGFALLLLFSTVNRLKETNHNPNPDATRVRGLIEIYRRIAGTGVFWAYALPGALSYTGIFVYISGSSFVLIKVLGVSTEIYGYCFGFGVTGYSIGTVVCRWLLGRIGMVQSLTVGTSLSLAAGLLFFALTYAGISHWLVVVTCMFLTMAGHGINFPCVQTGAVAPFPREAGSAAGLLGALTMAVAFVTGIWVGTSHDGTIRPLALISATINSLIFVSAWLLRHQRAKTA